MLSLVRNLPLILDDKVPSCEHWDLLMLLKKIIDVVTSNVIYNDTHLYLKAIVSDYLSLLTKLYDNPLNPKHHFLVHYSRIMFWVGPLWYICSMRYESKHRQGKIVSRSTVSRVNICRTIAIRHQTSVLNNRFVRN